jgi:PAS domain S-box-containing protein
MTFFNAMLLEEPAGKKRNLAAWWAFTASIVCAVLLWQYVAQLEAHQSEIIKVINYSSDGVIVCDRKGKVLFANDAVRVITGFSERDLVEHGLAQIIPDYLQDRHRQGLDRAKDKTTRGIEGIAYRNIYPVTRKDGATILCLVSVGSVLHFGGPQFFAYITPVAVPQPDAKQPAKSGDLSVVPPSNLN